MKKKSNLNIFKVSSRLKLLFYSLLMPVILLNPEASYADASEPYLCYKTSVDKEASFSCVPMQTSETNQATSTPTLLNSSFVESHAPSNFCSLPIEGDNPLTLKHDGYFGYSYTEGIAYFEIRDNTIEVPFVIDSVNNWNGSMFTLLENQYFGVINSSTTNPFWKASSIPEPSATTGLIAIGGIFVLDYWRKQYLTQKKTKKEDQSKSKELPENIEA